MDSVHQTFCYVLFVIVVCSAAHHDLPLVLYTGNNGCTVHQISKITPGKVNVGKFFKFNAHFNKQLNVEEERIHLKKVLKDPKFVMAVDWECV